MKEGERGEGQGRPPSYLEKTWGRMGVEHGGKVERRGKVGGGSGVKCEVVGVDRWEEG